MGRHGGRVHITRNLASSWPEMGCGRGSVCRPGSVAAGPVRNQHGAGADPAVDDAVAVCLLQAVGHIEDDGACILEWQPVGKALHIYHCPLFNLPFPPDADKCSPFAIMTASRCASLSSCQVEKCTAGLSSTSCSSCISSTAESCRTSAPMHCQWDCHTVPLALCFRRKNVRLSFGMLIRKRPQ